MECKYKDNGNGTVTDTETRLMWQQDTCPNKMSWDDAIKYCENLELAGHKDWRLPTVEELISLIDFNKYRPAIDTVYFPCTMSSNYWSSTTYAIYTVIAWLVYFLNGYVANYDKSIAYYVRAVRGE